MARIGSTTMYEVMNKKKVALLLITLNYVLLTQGQAFQEVCQGENTNGTIVSCEYFGDTLYSTGFFNTICDEPVGYVAKWENNEWSPSAINLPGPGHSFEVIDDLLYLAKYEESIDSNWVYVYDNSTLEKFGQGVYLTTASGFSQLPNIYDIVEFDGKVVVCGEFDRAGQASIGGIMQWSGSQWEPLGAGLTGNIMNTAQVIYPHQMMVHNSELYVVGNFRYAGGLEVNGVAKWDGTEWSGLGAGFNNTVYSISIFEDDLIVGGSFTESAGTPIDRIAKWDGIQWVALDFKFTETSSSDFIFVHTLRVIDEVLFIGGGLKEVTNSDNSTEVCNGIVSFDGTQLNTFNGGVEGYDIEAIIETQDEQLLVGGGVFGNGYSGILDDHTSIEENFAVNVKVSPNPFDNLVRIRSEYNFKEYRLFDRAGRLIDSGRFKKNLDLNLSSGFYTLKLLGDAYSSTHRIVKE